MGQSSLKTVVFVAGFQNSGKTTSAKKFHQLAESRGLSSKIIKIAGLIHQIQAVINIACGAPPTEKNRELMQNIGDAIRTTLGQDFFILATEREILEAPEDVIIIDDLRMPVEFALVTHLRSLPGLKVVCVLIDTPEDLRKNRRPETWSDRPHSTESLQKTFNFDFVIENKGDLGTLEQQVVEAWAKVESPVSWYAKAVDSLLKKYFGINLSDSIESDVNESLKWGLRPFEMVNALAMDCGLIRVDVHGPMRTQVGSFHPLTEKDEAEF